MGWLENMQSNYLIEKGEDSWLTLGPVDEGGNMESSPNIAMGRKKNHRTHCPIVCATPQIF